MTNIVEAAQGNIQRSDVQQAMKVLAKYGLGVNVPHMHGNVGEFEPLHENVISYEQNLAVSFHDESMLPEGDSIAVAWRWNEQTGKVNVTGKCRFGGSGCVSETI